MKTKKTLAKVVALALVVLCCSAVVLTGCKMGDGKGDDVDRRYAEKSKELGLDWDVIIKSVKDFDMTGTGFYIDEENLEEDVKEFYSVSFTNYDPAVKKSFKKVADQIQISYGIGTKNEYADEELEFYNEPVIEIYILSNSSGKSYTAVFNEDNELLDEDGLWYLDAGKDATIAGYIDFCLKAIGKK